MIDWLDEEEFGAAMYRYRSVPLDRPSDVIEAFEAVKKMIRERFRELDVWPDSDRSE